MDIKKRNLYIGIALFIFLLISGLIVGLILKFLLSIDEFLYIFLISFPFTLISYFSLRYTYFHFDNTSKGKISFLICYILRFVSIIGAIGFSILYLFLNDKMSAPSIYYILIGPLLFTIGYLVGVIFK